MIKAFEELGRRVAADWSRLGGGDDAFPEAATIALARSGVLATVELSDVVQWFTTSGDIPEQYVKEFGQPPINVYVAENFYIQVLVWIDGTTAIHEHSFAGAFGVLAGSSVHSRYRFEAVKPLSRELQLGHVHYVSSEILKRGDLRTIHCGSSFIHALFHLDRPSVSVVVRTKTAANSLQYSYLKPHVAFDPLFNDPLTTVRLRLLESLRAISSEQFWSVAGELIEQKAPWTIYSALATAYNKSRTEAANWTRLVNQAGEILGPESVQWMLASIKFEERSGKLARLRSVVHDANYRFLLALLLNVPSRDTLLALVTQHFGTKSPQSLVSRWLREMSAAGLFLARLDPDLLDVIELSLQYKSFHQARAAIINGDADYPALMDENRMRTVWRNASTGSFFQPLFETREGPQETLSTTAA
jgi:hypothetical protein